MIALPLPRTEPYGIPPDVVLDPAVILPQLRDEVPDLGAGTVDWVDLPLLTQHLQCERAKDGVRVRLRMGPRDLAVRATHKGPWTHVGALFQEIGEGLDVTTLLAIALVCAWQDPAWRRRLSQPSWKRALAGLVEAPPAEPGHEGWLCAVLLIEAPVRTMNHAVAGCLELGVIRLHRRTRERLPMRTVETEHDLRSLLPQPTEAEIALMRLMDARATVKRQTYGTTMGSIKQLDAQIFERAMGLREVFLGDNRVEVRLEPWTTTLRLEDTPGGGIRLGWSEVPARLWPVGPGWVLDDAGCIRPLAPALKPALGLLAQPLPEVAVADLPELLGTVLLRTQVPVALVSKHLEVRPGSPEPHLVLTWDGGSLYLSVRFSYGGAMAGEPDLVVTPEGLYQRDFNEESALVGEAEALLDGPLPQVRVGEAAYECLAEEVPLFEGWSLDVDRTLLPRVRGRMAARVQFDSGIDWFDLSVDLEVDGLRVPLQSALEAWRAGRRWVTLKDGSHARLPDAWLDRYAESAAELARAGAVREGNRRLGLAQAWAAEDLLAQAEASAEVIRWREKLGEVRKRIRDFSGLTTHADPPGVQAELRTYQRMGFSWLATLAELGLGGILADDMGLGKTLQALAWLLYETQRRPDAGPSLVVAPTSVIHNWASEAARFTPGLRVHVYHGTQRVLPHQVDVVVTTYALLVQDERLTTQRWRAVVLDEAQHIKNPVSARAQAAHGLEAEHRFCMTGTPLENNLAELWSLFQFAVPGLFGSLKAFNDEYARPIQGGDAAPMARLRARIRPFVLRRLKGEVASELPPRTEQVLMCTLGKAQRVLYESIREAYRDRVLEAVAERGVGGAALQVLEALTRMRQACCDPSLVPLPQARQVKQSAKRALLAELVESLVAEGRRTLVFSQWPSFLALVRADLEQAGHEYMYLDGQTTERASLQKRWNQPDGPPFFLISIKAGGTGLNLTGADVVIHLDPWWNPAVEDQATDRAHRIGQEKPVMVYKLVCQGTLEEKLVELQDRKRALFNATVNEERLLGESLTRADLEAVFLGTEVVDEEEAPVPGRVVDPRGSAPAATHPPARPLKAPVPQVPVEDDKVLLGRAFPGASTRTLAEVATALRKTPAAARAWLEAMIVDGWVSREGRTRSTCYRRV